VWWYIQNPDDVNICAVPKDGTAPEGDTSDLPLWNNPEVAQEGPGNGGGEGLVCNKDLNQPDCEAADGTWIFNVSTPNAIYCDCPQ
jgi:hypothetical protein